MLLEFLGDTFIQLMLGLVVAALVAPVVYLRRRVSRSDRDRLLNSGARAAGKVLEVWQSEDGWNVTYEFLPKGSPSPVRRTETYEEARVKPADVGAAIEVAHERAAPYHSTMVLAT